MIEDDPHGTSLDRSQTYYVPGENPLDAAARLYSAIEIACLDLIGKTVGKPVCDLLGGRARNEVPFSAYLFYKHAGGGGEGSDARTNEDEYGEGLTPEAMVHQAKQMIAKYGFRDIKLKAGVLEPDLEIETIVRLRRAFGPQVPLRLDPNCAWSVETSVGVGRSLKEELSGGGYLEDPCPHLEGMSEVRRRLLSEDNATPLASNVAVTWTAGNDKLPINCVNWYEAYAFCIWDGGFLPSEAEWEYAAAGGTEQRQYPWGTAAPGTTNQYAIYGSNYTGNSTGLAPVGTAAMGAGRWGQLDLATPVFANPIAASVRA